MGFLPPDPPTDKALAAAAAAAAAAVDKLSFNKGGNNSLLPDSRVPTTAGERARVRPPRRLVVVLGVPKVVPGMDEVDDGRAELRATKRFREGSLLPEWPSSFESSLSSTFVTIISNEVARIGARSQLQGKKEFEKDPFLQQTQDFI